MPEDSDAVVTHGGLVLASYPLALKLKEPLIPARVKCFDKIIVLGSVNLIDSLRDVFMYFEVAGLWSGGVNTGLSYVRLHGWWFAWKDHRRVVSVGF